MAGNRHNFWHPTAMKIVDRIEEVPLRRGEGRISGALSVFFGALSLLGVLCFHFPEYLTTPRLRASYDLGLLRSLLLFAMLAAVGFGVFTFFRWRNKRLGAVGIGLALVTSWLGGASVEVDDFQQPAISFGLDWFVLALLANTLIFVVVERLFPHRHEQLVLRREWQLDLGYYFFNHIMISVILLVTTAFSEQLFGWAVHDGVQAAVRAQPVWLQLVEVLFAADLVQYAGHRAMHEHPRLWNIHAVHHCPAEMDWLSGSRIHFIEVLFTRSTVLLPIYLLGFSETAVNLYVVWVGIQGVLIHSNTDLPLGPLRYLVTTPHFHHWHHAADAEAIDKNYAAHLPVIDMIFGTWVRGEDEGGGLRWPERYGVVGKALPQGFLAQHLYPFVAPPKGAEAAAAVERSS
jgi:sterol desaturase/sphingolipid hydroxylase (fatty acid hydroxylase superfamily)